jgi:Polysaccharide lyase
MLHNLFSIALPTSLSPRAWKNGSKFGVSCLVLMGALWLIPLASVHGQTTVHYNFEDGILRGDPTKMQVPPKILTENGNEFTRITGSAGDKESIPSSHPNRNRSTVQFTSSYSSMPLISDANMRQTYSAKIRFHDNTGTDGVVFELFQYAPGGESGGYGTRNGTGPVIICWRKDGRVQCRANYANETKADTVDLGAIPAGTWHTYMVKAVWSHNPSAGRIEIYLDGTLKKRITGRDVNLGPASNRLPSMKLGLYGDYAVGKIDVDNVNAGPSSSTSSTVALNSPTNVRVVSGQ